VQRVQQLDGSVQGGKDGKRNRVLTFNPLSPSSPRPPDSPSPHSPLPTFPRSCDIIYPLPVLPCLHHLQQTLPSPAARLTRPTSVPLPRSAARSCRLPFRRSSGRSTPSARSPSALTTRSRCAFPLPHFPFAASMASVGGRGCLHLSPL
jgi:hypothetical protein